MDNPIPCAPVSTAWAVVEDEAVAAVAAATARTALVAADSGLAGREILPSLSAGEEVVVIQAPDSMKQRQR